MAIESREMLIDEIANALEMHFDGLHNYLNLTQQEFGLWSDYDVSDNDELRPKADDEVIEITPLPSRESFQAMKEFADAQPQIITEKLYRALNGSRPFARFKAATDILDLLQDWYAFKNKWYREKAEEWLRDEGLDFVEGKIVAKGPIHTWED